MKILRVIPSMDPKHGGPCQGIRNAIPELQKLGAENEVVCLDDPNATYLGKDGFTIHAIGAYRGPWQYNKNLVPWLLKHFGMYDVVIVHAIWLYHSHAVIKAIRRFRKTNALSPKIFMMPHGMLDPYFQKAKERRLKAFRNKVYWRLFENEVINEADGVVFTCQEELLLARTTFKNYRPKKEINVGYGVQQPPTFSASMHEAFTAKVMRWNKEPFLLFLSRVHQKKGIALLIKAYLKLEKERSTMPQLIIAGPGLGSVYGKQIQALAQNSQNIIFTGMLSGAAKWGAFYESEAFVLPSHQENFGIAVVEALACTKPVLISNKVNIWREIEKGKGGLVKNDTEHDTYNLLKQWLSLSKGRKEKMTISARKVYEDFFTINSAATQFLKAIQNA